MADLVATIEEAIAGRRTVRAFRRDPVEQGLIERLLDIAARAPSGTNMQPWRVYAVAGSEKTALVQALIAAHSDEPDRHTAEYEYYPSTFPEPYLSRRRKVGWDLYGILGITRAEKDRMHEQHARNFAFFDAPVGLVFTISRRLEIGSWLDYGMFLQNIMIAARAHGLETCVQAAFAPFHAVIRQHLPIDPDEVVVCGMSIGYEDTEATVNRLATERHPARDFTSFVGFGQA